MIILRLTDNTLLEADLQNQGAQELAKEYDPAGKRTIGELLDKSTNEWTA